MTAPDLTPDERARLLADALARHRAALLAAVVGHGTIGGHDARRLYREGVARLLGDLADEAGAGVRS